MTNRFNGCCESKLSGKRSWDDEAKQMEFKCMFCQEGEYICVETSKFNQWRCKVFGSYKGICHLPSWYSSFNWKAWTEETLVRYRRRWGDTVKKPLKEIRERIWIDLIRLYKWHRNFSLCKGRGILWLTVGNYFLNNESLAWSKIRQQFFFEDYYRLGYDVWYSSMLLANIRRKPLLPSSGWKSNFRYCYFTT